MSTQQHGVPTVGVRAMTRTFLVLLLNRQGRPWSDTKALRLVVADTAEEAVRAAHDFPPSYDVSHAWVIEVKGQPVQIPVRVPRPEWAVDEAKAEFP